MAKRLIIPVKAVVSVVAGTATIAVPELTQFAGFFRYIVVEGPALAKGRVKIRDTDESQDVYRDPRDSRSALLNLEYYSQSISVPINGPCQIIIDSATVDGSYTVYYVVEERPTRV